jgi:hypothetical protein
MWITSRCLLFRLNFDVPVKDEFKKREINTCASN